MSDLVESGGIDVDGDGVADESLMSQQWVLQCPIQMATGFLISSNRNQG